MKHKIIRSWESKSKKFKIGQDEQGRIFAKCIECNTNANIIKDFDFKRNNITSKAVCPNCKSILRL